MLIIQLPEGVDDIRKFGGSMKQIRNADVVINGSGCVLKDRDGAIGRSATGAELEAAEQVE